MTAIETRAPVPRAPMLASEVRAALNSCRGLLDSVGSAVKAAGSWEASDRERVITDLDKLIQAASIARGKVLLAHERQGRWGSVSDRDFADWRARTTGAGRGVARGELELAKGLNELPEVAEAVEAGEVGIEHAKALTRVWHQSSPQVKKALADGEMSTLLTAAPSLSAPQLAQRAKRRAAAIDAAQAQADHETVMRRRKFR